MRTQLTRLLIAGVLLGEGLLVAQLCAACRWPERHETAE